ncbi:ATP synthase mitochondrial F1 complex assembly factor 1-like isoform X2 [Artemia franciscana]|uniref:ATP synthase mitochondrial F1 complex assembly factor 1-like isoform X2 n=1 Tax=Artemia franciscana TaxID=6661 RepID=UPI0032D9D8CD
MLRKIHSIGLAILETKPILLSSLYTVSKKLSNISVGKEDMEELQKNPYYSKYAGKIEQMKKNSPSVFEEKLKQTEEIRKEAEKRTDFSVPSTTPKSNLTQQFYKEKIWNSFYSGKDGVVTAMIPKDKYTLIKERSSKYPIFVFPLPRSEGYEFFLCQFSGNECHFTSLINYQTYKENAPECFTIVHYPDLIDEKGVVLMKGDYDKNVLKSAEAQCLANEIQLYYGKEDPKKTALLETFTNKPDTFNYNDLVEEVNSISLS